MNIIQLNPPIPLDTPKGAALAHIYKDVGIESNSIWVCFLDSNGEIWEFENHQVRAQKNITIGRTYEKQIKEFKYHGCL